jgi:FKBP-type peptidyl-prolyl cis-trans isomerase FklB
MSFKTALLFAAASAICLPALADSKPADSLASGPASAAPALDAAKSDAKRDKVVFNSEKDQVSYSVGVQSGRAMRSADGAEVNFDAMVQGLKDGLDGVKAQLSERKMQELLGKFQQALRQKMIASRNRAKVENAEAAGKFLTENKTKPGVVTLDTGVQYRPIQTGTGPHPTESDAVTVRFRGTLLNGKEFDATDADHATLLRVSTLVAGWKQVLKLMPVGSHWQVFIPPSLGYGDRGVGADVGPNELLIFDIELLGTRPSNNE